MKANKKNYVILVDPNDRVIGKQEKILAHQYGMLHRAFSVFIFREHDRHLELLLQQRSRKKYYGGGLWTNTCCSHPRPLETNIKKSAMIRLQEEMGFQTRLTKKGVFHYVAQFDNGLVENEIDHVFVGNFDEETIAINPEEVDAYEWVNVALLQIDLITHPKKYSPWLKQGLEIALNPEKPGKKNK